MNIIEILEKAGCKFEPHAMGSLRDVAPVLEMKIPEDLRKLSEHCGSCQIFEDTGLEGFHEGLILSPLGTVKEINCESENAPLTYLERLWIISSDEQVESEIAIDLNEKHFGAVWYYLVNEEIGKQPNGYYQIATSLTEFVEKTLAHGSHPEHTYFTVDLANRPKYQLNGSGDDFVEK